MCYKYHCKTKSCPPSVASAHSQLTQRRIATTCSNTSPVEFCLHKPEERFDNRVISLSAAQNWSHMYLKSFRKSLKAKRKRPMLKGNVRECTCCRIRTKRPTSLRVTVSASQFQLHATWPHNAQWWNRKGNKCVQPSLSSDLWIFCIVSTFLCLMFHA